MKITKPLIIDTNVFIDMFLNIDEQHEIAEKIGNYLIENNIIPLFPYHQVYEIAMVTKRNLLGTKQELKANLLNTSLEGKKLHLNLVNIDSKFFSKYYNPAYPYVRGMDYIFMALAKGENAILITRDNNLYEKSNELGVEVYKPIDFVRGFIDIKP